MRSLLLPWFSKAFWRGSHTTTSVTCGWIRSYNQAAEVPSSKVTCKSPRSPRRNCRRVIALVSITHSMPSCRQHSEPRWRCFPCGHPGRYTSRYPCRALLSVGVVACTQTLPSKGRPLYCVFFSEAAAELGELRVEFV